KIATNISLDALVSRKHVQRLLPDQHAPATGEMPDGKPATDVAWLEPYPDSNLEGIADDAPHPARPSNSLLSPPSSSCRRANARCSCSATCTAGQPRKPRLCLAAQRRRSTAPYNGRVRR